MREDSSSGPGELIRSLDLALAVLSHATRLPRIYSVLRRIRGLRDDSPLSLGRLLERNAERYPERPALYYEDRKLTHDELNRAVNRYTHYLAGRGVSKGDVAVLLIDNRPELLLLIGALAKLGAVASLINPAQHGEALKHSLRLTPGTHYVLGEKLLDAFEQVRPGLGLSASDSIYLQRDAEGPLPEGYVDLREGVRRQSEEDPLGADAVTLGDPYAYVFTSGTTGLPKAAIQTHRRWIAGGLWFGRAVMDLRPSDVLYCPLPVCHTNGLNVAWAPAAAAGAALALRRKFSTRGFWEDVRRFEATAFVYIGEICRYLLNQPARPDDREHPVRKIVGNGLRPEIWSTFKERFGISRVHELYGAAEAPLALVNLFDLVGTVGTSPAPHRIVRYDTEAERPLRNADGFMEPAAVGETGLLLAEISERFPFAGYTDEAESEKKILRNVFREGDAWFDSGDLLLNQGYRHARFVDRLGDTFRWKGENVSTTEVERVVNSLPGVAESTAYGVPVPGAEGRAGMVAIVAASRPESFDLVELAAILKRELPSYAVPRFVRLVSRLETTATLKIRRGALKREGFDLQGSDDPLFVLLSGEPLYRRLTPETCEGILAGRHRL